MKVRLTTTKAVGSSDQTPVLASLAEIRKEWQALADGKSLLDIEAPIGLILFDIANRLALSPQQCLLFLGQDLMEEASRFANQPLNIEILQ